MRFLEKRVTDPLENIFIDIQKIMNFIEIKDMRKALAFETKESKYESEIWMAAKTKTDNYLSYREYWTIGMFQFVLHNVKLSNVHYWMDHPMNVPMDFRDHLLEKGREFFLKRYEEKNNYYRMLNGLPVFGETKDEYLYMPDKYYALYRIEKVPIHEVSVYYQNKFIHTEDFLQMIKDHPDKKYLNYLGKYKIDPYVARNAYDFEIIRYPKHDTTINPYLLKEFGKIYTEYREYMMQILYVKPLEDSYDNYHEFMQLLLFSFTLTQLSNKTMEYRKSMTFMDDTSLYILLSLYGIHKNIHMTKSTRRNLVRNLLQLTREKGNSDIYQKIVQILEYENVSFHQLLLHKSGDKVCFKEIPIKDHSYNQYINGKEYSYEEIIQGDPRWWDTPESRKKLREAKFTLSDTKYINIKSTIRQMQSMFEIICFIRMILDNKEDTDNFMITIPELFGVKEISIYDCIVFLLCALCMKNHLPGTIGDRSDQLFAVMGFNFHLDMHVFEKYLVSCKYVDRERIMEFMNEIDFQSSEDISRVCFDVLYPLREYLENKISTSTHRKEWIEYENIYKALFTYDISYHTFYSDYQKPMEMIKTIYGLSDEDLLMFQHFYPRTISGKAITEEDFKSSQYKEPFLDRKTPVTWYIDLKEKGKLYFHDILNAEDLRFIKNTKDQYIFLDDKGDIDEKTVDLAIKEIGNLKGSELQHAYFQINTNILNSGGRMYTKNELLSEKLRSVSYKDIFIDKIIFDILGYEEPPKTYIEYLERKNDDLYQLLTKEDRFHKNKEAWNKDVSTVLSSLESQLNVHIRYIEHDLIGKELYFQPLIQLIQRFKSSLIEIAKTDIEFLVDDKVDAGGNSNTLKLFDEIWMTINFLILSKKGYDSPFGLYDTIHKITYKTEQRDSMGLSDEATFTVIKKK